MLAGCVSMHASPSQNYRLAGDDAPVTITGSIKQTESLIVKAELSVFFNGKKTIEGPLTWPYTGDIQGQQWNGRATSASCSSKQRYDGGYDVQCMVFVDNERTVTLTF